MVITLWNVPLIIAEEQLRLLNLFFFNVLLKEKWTVHVYGGENCYFNGLKTVSLSSVPYQIINKAS